MTSKERGQFVRHLLKCQSKRIENIISMYFGIGRDRSSLEEIGHELDVPTRQIRYRLNKGVNKIRVF